MSALGAAYAGKVAAFTPGPGTQVRMSVRRFDSFEGAEQVLASYAGEWLIASVETAAPRPRLAHLDPFTESVGVAGSHVAWGGGSLRGPFVGELEHFERWILDHFPSGYYAVQVLERRLVINHGAASPPAGAAYGAPEAHRGSYLALRAFADGTTRLEGVHQSLAQAEIASRNEAGRWLLAEVINSVVMQ